MENIVYERDYKEEKARRDMQTKNTVPSRVWDYMVTSGTLDSMSDAYMAMPRIINAGHKAAYERILTALDRIAKTFGGKIKGVVDYQNWEANIYVVLPFVEFSSEEELALMQDIASNSQTVAFTATPDGNVRLKILIDYFEVVGNFDDMLEKEIENCPELVAMLEEADRAEKQQLMANPQIAMIVRIGAESLGTSEEDYLNRVVNFLRNPPEGFLDAIQGWLEKYAEDE